jgi:AraC-like DNA-binding protein
VLNDAAGLPYISGAVLYSALIYFSLVIILNKGYIINMAAPKYDKTDVAESEKQRIISELNILMNNDKILADNTISLSRLAKKLNTSNHTLSQTINESERKTFFELLGTHRINEAKILLKKFKSRKVSDIAFEVGYNSLSAFNSAFKKESGLTPTIYRNGRQK